MIASSTRRTPGRRPVSPPVERASTLLSGEAGSMRDLSVGPTYGLEGLSAARALRAALADLEGAADAFLTPSGLSAVTMPLLALTRPGDEILTTDAVYGPTRRFLNRFMAARGVTTRFHSAGADAERVAALIGERTRVILIESPGSLTFDMLDVPTLAAATRARGVLTVMDNTWAAGLAFRPLAHGVDVSIQALTKYAAGHSDLLMGCVAAADPAVLRPIEHCVEDLGWHVSPDDAWLALRGLRTLPLRMAEHARSALRIAEWLQARPEVDRVLYPPLPGSVGHDLWTRDYTGAAGLMGVVLKGDPDDGDAFLDALTLFGLGYSWGGFESLVTHETGQLSFRRDPPVFPGPLIRLNIGLEAPEDLIADLAQALDRWPARG